MITATTIVLAAALALQGGGAKPQQDPSTDRAVFEQARREHQLGNYDAAAATFSELYRRTGDATMLFNTAQALRLAGHNSEALAAYRGYLRERPDAGTKAMVDAKIREMEAAAALPPGKRHAPERSETDLVDPMTEPRRGVPTAALPSGEAKRDSGAAKPVWKRWWLWAAVGTAVVGGTVAAVAVSRSGTDIPGTPLGNQGIFR